MALAQTEDKIRCIRARNNDTSPQIQHLNAWIDELRDDIKSLPATDPRKQAKQDKAHELAQLIEDIKKEAAQNKEQLAKLEETAKEIRKTTQQSPQSQPHANLTERQKLFEQLIEADERFGLARLEYSCKERQFGKTPTAEQQKTLEKLRAQMEETGNATLPPQNKLSALAEKEGAALRSRLREYSKPAENQQNLESLEQRIKKMDKEFDDCMDEVDREYALFEELHYAVHVEGQKKDSAKQKDVWRAANRKKWGLSQDSNFLRNEADAYRELVHGDN